MLREISIGKYYNVDSVLHRLDARVKIRLTLIYLILLFVEKNIILYAFLTFLLIAIILISKVPFGHIIKGMTMIFVVVTIFAGINIFTTEGNVLMQIGILTITKEGILKFAFVLWRVILLILGSSIIMYTTRPYQLTMGLEKCFFLPPKLSMGITIALRFLSMVFENLRSILDAQKARGINFNEGSVKIRIQKLKSTIMSLFRVSIEQASNLGDSMDMRGYTGRRGRTRLYPLKYDKNDFLWYIIGLIVIAIAIFIVKYF